jgi:hypothetical protein
MTLDEYVEQETPLYPFLADKPKGVVWNISALNSVLGLKQANAAKVSHDISLWYSQESVIQQRKFVHKAAVLLGPHIREIRACWEEPSEVKADFETKTVRQALRILQLYKDAADSFPFLNQQLRQITLEKLDYISDAVPKIFELIMSKFISYLVLLMFQIDSFPQRKEKTALQEGQSHRSESFASRPENRSRWERRWLHRGHKSSMVGDSRWMDRARQQDLQPIRMVR